MKGKIEYNRLTILSTGGIHGSIKTSRKIFGGLNH